MGFDDLRRFCEIQGGPLPIYGSQHTLTQLERVFFYAFSPKNKIPGYVHVIPHVISGPFEMGGLKISPLSVPHGSVTTLGFLFSHGERRMLAYISDCAAVPDPVREIITDVEVLIIDGLREKPHPTHLNIASAVEAAQAVRARQSFLTHLTHEKTHVDRAAGLPPGIGVAYDGMKLEFELK
jgi:phosphoribosyl 1,2-cyclic phosphate phosphodiesterase